MRTLSTEFNTAADAQQTGEVFLTLLTVSYDGTKSVNCAVNSVTKTITRTTGSWTSSGVAVGSFITFAGFSNGANNDTFEVTAVTPLVMTLGNSTTLVTEGAIDITYTHVLRFVNNHESVVSNGDTYLGLAFNFTMPQDGENQRSAGIEMDNVDRRLSTFLLGAGVVDITVNEQLILISDPDTAEITRDYSLKNVSINRKTVSGELKYLQYLTDAFPTLTKTPSKFPGVF
jgi:hypothetical protein